MLCGIAAHFLPYHGFFFLFAQDFGIGIFQGAAYFDLHRFADGFAVAGNLCEHAQGQLVFVNHGGARNGEHVFLLFDAVHGNGSLGLGGGNGEAV